MSALVKSPSLYWFLKGTKGILSLPAFILMGSCAGFAALALESGLTRGHAVLMTVGIWALPAQIILTGAMSTGLNIAAAFLAVTFSSIRFMPMLAALVPELRNERTPLWKLLTVSHFTAITSWVFAITHIREVPREYRMVWFTGFAVPLTMINTVIVAVGYGVLSAFPPILSAVLAFMTPVYFMLSMWGSARDAMTRVAFIAGLVLGPAVTPFAPQFDIFYAGIGGGTAVYLLDRWRRARKEDRS
ncbi:AzlC family ABC transporter permease [Rhizobiaceae bacterium BDR2-2]|uniref:AzlC family ABC transporter permease n=1 Tax=Ectorhizobium quercum TaxID=2965071 RepID=A0AAE3SWP1_9HYPH|nr:AzlC family ABC transporter permease [Ectorhizobium quercum]MCX8997615.1 AzlC family ABC transporter permease [Ectorhizobium quercum]